MNNFKCFSKIILSSTIALFSSCSIKQDRSSCMAPVTVRICDFIISQDEYPQTKTGTAIGSYSGVNAISVTFFQGTVEKYNVTQYKNDSSTYETFGEFSCYLPYGSYTMVVVGHGGDPEDGLTITSPTFASFEGLRPRETFLAAQSFNIEDSTPVNLSATLRRISARLRICSTDGRAEMARSVRMIFSAGAKGFNPSTGLATSNSGFDNTVGISTSAGTVSATIGYLFLLSDEQNMDVTIETLDSDENVLFKTTVPNVPFKRNRVTVLTGKMYSATASASGFLVDSEYAADDEVIQF